MHDFFWIDSKCTSQGSLLTGGHLGHFGETSCKKRGGHQYQNALMESFFKTLKRELINRAHYCDYEEAKQDIFKYI